VHARGEPLAALWASEAGIYERFGYGMSFLCGDIDLTRAHARLARPVEAVGQARIVTLEEALALFPRVYDRVAETTPGMIRRSPKWWQHRILKDEEWRRGGGGELAAVVLEVDGRPEAYALYRLNFAYDDGLPTGKTVVVEAMGATPQATAAVWRYLLEIDWMERVEATLLPLDHPLLHLLAEPSRLHFRVGDGVWVRLVDVGAALAERSLAGDDELVLAVSDVFCPWNDACFALDGSKRTSDPDLRLGVDALGSAYLGGFSFTQLARAGRVEELTEGALARADALFRTDAAPWCPEIF
jgi:predicted acetyltransferase